MTIEQYHLTEEELRAWAQRCMELRAAIVQRSQEHAVPEPDVDDNDRPERSRKGLRNSRRGQNAEGRTEAQLRHQSQQDKAHCRKYKKRSRKDLSYEEIEQVIAATKQPYLLHKDIAQQFKIPAILVSRLVKESQEKPEKLQQKQAE